MITKENALRIAEEYIKDRKREFIKINEDKIVFEKNKYINYGKYYEKHKDIFTVPYEEEGYINPTSYFVAIDSESGEVLYTISKHGYVEDWEEDENSNFLE